MPALPPRATTPEHAAKMLRARITQGRLLPGTRLREEQVAAALGISRNTVREAFQLPAHDHLVDHAMHRGVHVRMVPADDIRAMYATRGLVEPLAVTGAISDGVLRAALRDLVDGADAAAGRDDGDQAGTADINFHRLLMSACHSSHLSNMFEQLLAELRLAFLLIPDRPTFHEPYIGRNRRLVDLLDAGDPDIAVRELRDYLDAAERALLDSVR
ncbi:MAG TPA: GntR family transcriptional regulator [Dermatophilaceae bacterium]|nr:GntR family transcriptional regulator [Dermatophilaceae bacterium]